MKKLISILLAGGLVFGVVGAAQAGGKAATMWKDDSGDADLGQGLGASIPGGFDLAGGSIVKNGANLDFTVTHHDMPPTGSAPEAARFLWNFNVGKAPFRLTVKSADIGKPDVFTQTGTERIGRVDVQGHFRLEGACETTYPVPANFGFVNCPVIGYFDGSFDPASKSFTASIPLKALKAKPGSVVTAGGDNICPICWVSHYAERSLSPTTIIDGAAQTGSYKVPR